MVYRGGELFQHLRNARRFDENRAKFYAAEIVLALEYLHKIDVVYRDLKPENILMDDVGHICLADFGMAKQLKANEKTYTLVGTPEYLAPEIVDGVGHNRPADWWALGVFMYDGFTFFLSCVPISYEMLIGIPPFYNRDQNYDLIYKMIREKEVGFGTKIPISTNAKDLILNVNQMRFR